MAVGIKKTGVKFDSIDGELSKVFIMVISPKKVTGVHVQFLAAIGSILGEKTLREALINATTPEEAVQLFTVKK